MIYNIDGSQMASSSQSSLTDIHFGGTMNSSSPAHSSLSTTAVVGGGGGGGGSSNATVSIDDFHLPCDPISSQERKDEAMIGGLHSIYFVVIFIQN